jgi:hypothetical protein
LTILRFIGKTHNRDSVPPGKKTDLVEGTDFLSFVRRIRNAMSKI